MSMPECCNECGWKDCKGCSVMENMIKEATKKSEMNRKNSEGYIDLTAHNAVKRADNFVSETDHRRFKKVVKAINSVCDAAGFEVKGRVILKDKMTGKTWK